MNRLAFIPLCLVLLFALVSTAPCGDPSQPTDGDCDETDAHSTPPSLKSPVAEVANVRDFGAVGDGIANDQPAIAAAIAKTTGTVFFPPGVYRIDVPIVIAKPIVLAGVGSDSVIKAVDCNSSWPHAGNDVYPLISIRPVAAYGSFSEVTVEKLLLDGSCSSRSYSGWEWNAGVEVAASGTWSPRNIRLRELHIRDVGGDGITVRGDPTTTNHSAMPSDIIVENNFIERWHQHRQGIAVAAGIRVRISRNLLVLGIPPSGICPPKTSTSTDPSDANYGIDLETHTGVAGDVIAQVQVSENVVHNCNGGINISNSVYPKNSISNIAVHDNTIVASGGRPLKPLQVNGEGISGYVEYNNRNDDAVRLFQNAPWFWRLPKN